HPAKVVEEGDFEPSRREVQSLPPCRRRVELVRPRLKSLDSPDHAVHALLRKPNPGACSACLFALAEALAARASRGQWHHRFRRPPASIGDHRGAASHSFDRYKPELLLPREQECPASPQMIAHCNVRLPT